MSCCVCVRTLGSAVGRCGARADARCCCCCEPQGCETRAVYARRDRQDRSPDNIKRTGHLSDLILTVCVKEEASSRYYVAALWMRAYGSELATM